MSLFYKNPNSMQLLSFPQNYGSNAPSWLSGSPSCAVIHIQGRSGILFLPLTSQCWGVCMHFVDA